MRAKHQADVDAREHCGPDRNIGIASAFVNEQREAAESARGLAQVAGILRERSPAPALRSHVDAVWTNEILVPTALDIVPDGCVDVYWAGDRLRIAGPNMHVITASVANATTLAGVRFRPGVACRWLGISALDIVNKHVALEEIWSPGSLDGITTELSQAGSVSSAALTLENWVLEQLRRSAPDPLISAVVAAATGEKLHQRGLIRELTAELGVSERTLRRRCREAFGYGPKTLERIIRFQRFLRRLPDDRTPLSMLAIEAGYADQAHLSREVRKLCGQCPSALMAALQA